MNSRMKNKSTQDSKTKIDFSFEEVPLIEFMTNLN